MEDAELTIHELTTLKHQHNHHWLSHLKTLHTYTRSPHPTTPSLSSLPQTTPGNTRTQPFLTSSLPVKSLPNHQKIFQSSEIRSLIVWTKLRYFPVCMCVYILPPWRFLPTARCPRHAWEVRIKDLVLWIFIWVLLPSSFISISESIIFHFQRRNSSPPKNWRENDIIYCTPAKRWYTWI